MRSATTSVRAASPDSDVTDEEGPGEAFFAFPFALPPRCRLLPARQLLEYTWKDNGEEPWLEAERGCVVVDTVGALLHDAWPEAAVSLSLPLRCVARQLAPEELPVGSWNAWHVLLPLGVPTAHASPLTEIATLAGMWVSLSLTADPSGGTPGAAEAERQAAWRCRLESTVGTGGTATVYLVRAARARQQEREEALALKLPQAQGRESLLREARLLARFTACEWVLRPLAFVYESEGERRPGLLFLVFPDGDLQDKISLRACSLPELHTLSVCLCMAMHHLHASGVVHRDIKPENVLVQERAFALQHARLCDLGIAVDLLRDDAEYATKAAGTLGYCAPEVIRGLAGAAAPPSDVYGTGATLFAAACRRAPFRGDGTALHKCRGERADAYQPSTTRPRGCCPRLRRRSS